MKNIIILILIIFSLNGCLSTKYGFSSSELEKNYRFVENIMKNIDSLENILSDTSKVSKYISKNISRHAIVSKNLKDYIIDNKFLDGYDYADEDIYYIGYNPESTNYNEENVIKTYTHGIKLKSRYNGEIIWFLFQNEEPGVWKFKGFKKCNNHLEMVPGLDIPCDKK